ncbi:cell division regulator GpsB [Ornithinibacillus bavariensis]|uniref:Cell cycle protein GpsB n=1 Tax=Ornithinibacillus bavariensis TaxID=545502 RepID=A0A920C6Y5_9BACI|nr:cell division regulator GpsB [Ornithinibacillus bavariensis]GIO28421.1 cell cycle protein GpsB [Ornithinibacillus bavariensis]HAM81148.1 cell division regulator GpsB [Ornithinibacillus sp.]
MNGNQIKLSGKDILEKDFKTAMRGYNQEEVDEFLDIVIQDYEAFTQEIDRLKQEIIRLKKSSENQVKTRSASGAPQVNYDVLKRLSNLEKAVFGSKYANADS